MINPFGTTSFVTRRLACSAQSATSLPSNFRVGPLANHWISARNIGLILETLALPIPIGAHVSCQCCCCYVIDVIASRWRLVRPNCRNAVIVRLRAGDLGVEPAFGRTLRGALRERRFGRLVAGALAIAHSHRKNETPTNNVSESMPRFTFATRFSNRNARYFTQALANFGAGEILQAGECRRHDRRAPPGVPGTRPGSVWCATPNG